MCVFPPSTGNSWNNPCDRRDSVASYEGKCLQRDKSAGFRGFLAGLQSPAPNVTVVPEGIVDCGGGWEEGEGWLSRQSFLSGSL